MPSGQNSKWRIGIAFAVLIAALAAGAYFVADLGKLQENISAGESRQAVQDITDVSQIEAVSRKYGSSKLLQVIAMATRAAAETGTATEKLMSEVAPPAAAREFNFGAASRADLEALRRDIKTAQANAAAFMPRFAELLKRERDAVRTNALWSLKEDAVAGLLDNIDKRHADMTAVMSRLLAARGDFYRAYDDFVAVLIDEFGKYKVVDGQLVFPSQRTLARYNVAANAMLSAKNRVTGVDAERKTAIKSGQERWLQFVKGQ
ncbi:hypothetical protein JQ628_15685 [Bradyrhizobium lablabi]|uniref:hypothetical protein n=1 Tax=Bradyrhizobium lablabi TaxID=722472 RepID=UPI001BAB6258|nr:hypothetical protein [Bradyrhizobium lablabi]MBR1122968.1 hypothetical protein [Bradyrhizobium lablabi]